MAVCWVCTVEMHARRGAELTWIDPEEDASGTRRSVFEAELPFACLGEASSSRAQDARDTAATRFVIASGERWYFGCAASRTDCGNGAARGARQRAVALVAATPVFDLLEEKVLVLASLPPDDDATRAAYQAAQKSVAADACTRYDDFATACPCRAVVRQLGAKAVADATLAGALAAKIVVYGAAPAEASACCLALAALQPGLMSLGVTTALEEINPRLHVHAFRWRARGFPLLDYEAWPVQPLATVATVDRYAPEGVLDGAAGAGGYCLATTNAMVAKRLARHADIVIDVDAGTVERRTPLAKAAAADKASGTIAKILAAHAAAPLYSIAYRGGDAWTRRSVEDALYAALRGVAAPQESSIIGRALVRALRGATKTWGELAQATPHFVRWRRHAQATEEPAAEAPVFMETYEGERDEAGRRRGTGRCVAPTHTYEGAWLDDAAHGEGVLTTSKFTYEGSFRDSAFHGAGRWRRADGSRSYEGEFEAGEFHGAGKLEQRATGDGAWVSFVGEWSRGKRHGTGTCVYADESTYSGEWSQGLPHGEGVRTCQDTVYRGQFVRGLKHGAGVLTTDEDVYDGVFCNDAMAPEATFTVTYGDGRRYGGRLKDGVPAGSNGMMKYADGSFYEGDFSDGLRSGRGTLFEGKDLEEKTGDWRCDVLVQLKRAESSNGSAPSLSNWRSLDDEDAAFESSSSEDDDAVATAFSPTPPTRRVSGTFDEREGASSTLAAAPPRADEVSRQPRRGVARVRFPNGDVYDGGFARSLRDGRGVFEEALTGHLYDGDWVRGERDGEGDFASGDGAFRYSGTWRKGRREGRGKATIHGSTYDGSWKEDAFHGAGLLVDTAGNRYEGEFCRGRKHGSGTQTYADGSKYSGEWDDGARHGTGHLIARDGSTYSGQWGKGVPSGEGTRVAPSGATHRGIFNDGTPHGWGVATEDGVEREGEWEHGSALEDCDWTLKYADGRRYAGRLKEGAPHGAGVMKWASGESYAGAFAECRRAGRGIAVFADGSIYDGLWRHDHPALVGQGKLTRADGSIVFAEPHQ